MMSFMPWIQPYRKQVIVTDFTFHFLFKSICDWFSKTWNDIDILLHYLTSQLTYWTIPRLVSAWKGASAPEPPTGEQSISTWLQAPQMLTTCQATLFLHCCAQLTCQDTSGSSWIMMINCSNLPSTKEGSQDTGLEVLKLGKSQTNQGGLAT